MTQEFIDDLADGGGLKPAKEMVVAVRDHLKRHNRDHSIRKVHEELRARNFEISVATVQRHLRGIGQGKRTLSPTTRADRRVRDKRYGRLASARKGSADAVDIEKSPLKLEDCKAPAQIKVPTLAELVAEDQTSTLLAIRENRARMALNIIIAEQMSSRPELLLLDMRGTAALVDALTVGTKLSGGHSIDISMPSDQDRAKAANGFSPGGHEMRDITPAKSELVTDIEKWRRTRENA